MLNKGTDAVGEGSFHLVEDCLRLSSGGVMTVFWLAGALDVGRLEVVGRLRGKLKGRLPEQRKRKQLGVLLEIGRQGCRPLFENLDKVRAGGSPVLNGWPSEVRCRHHAAAIDHVWVDVRCVVYVFFSVEDAVGLVTSPVAPFMAGWFVSRSRGRLGDWGANVNERWKPHGSRASHFYPSDIMARVAFRCAV
jgi:hypothetical protein